MCLTLVMSSSGASGQDLPDLRGAVNLWDAEQPELAAGMGLNVVPLTGDGRFTCMKQGLRSTNGMQIVGDTLYSLDYDLLANATFMTALDLHTWEVISKEKVTDNVVFANCTTYDPTTGRWWGCFNDDDLKARLTLGYADYPNMTRIPVAKMPETLRLMACDSHGQLYGVTTAGNNLVKINRTTGAFTPVKEAIVPAGSTGGCVIDWNHDVMYLTSKVGGVAKLMKIDPATGEVISEENFARNQDVTSLWIATGDIVDIPEAPVTVTATPGDNEVVITWTPVSATLRGLKMAPADITYRVTRQDGHVVAENATGTTITDDVTGYGDFAAYQYSVQAVYHGNCSVKTSAPTVYLGSINTPYIHNFNAQPADALYGWTIINGNNDQEGWKNFNGTTWSFASMEKDNDYWLISPPLHLEAGKAYYFSFDCAAKSPSYKQMLEIKMGNAPSVEGLTETLIAATDQLGSSTAPVKLDASFTPAETRNYYFAAHDISPVGGSYIAANSMSIFIGGAPAAVTAMAITPDAQGEQTATVSLTAPVKSLDGKDLAEPLERIDITDADANVMATFTAPQPGDTLSATVTFDAPASYTLTATPYNAAGPGLTATATAFVGIGVPQLPTNVAAVPTENPGEVTVTWTAPTKSVNNLALKADDLTFGLYEIQSDGHWRLIQDGITADSVTAKVMEAPYEQKAMRMGVRAKNTAGEGNMAASTTFFLGKPYTVPYNDSFANGEAEHTAIIRAANGQPIWYVMTDRNIQGIAAQDGDNGYLAEKATTSGWRGLYNSGRIDLGQLQKPVLKLWAYAIDFGETFNANILHLSAIDAEGRQHEIAAPVMGNLPHLKAWNQIKASLGDFRGQTIQYLLDVETRASVWTLLDNITISEAEPYDLSLGLLAAPSSVKPNQDFTLSATVTNMGLNAAPAYNVNAYLNDELVHTFEAKTLEADSVAVFTLPQQLTAMAPEKNVYRFDVVFDQDADTCDNSTLAKVSVVMNPYPVTTLQGELDSEQRPSLTWTEPSTDVPQAFTQGFETWANNSQEPEDGWTYVDGDDGKHSSISGVVIPNHKSQLGTYVVIAGKKDYNKNGYAKTGDKALLAIKNLTRKHVEINGTDTVTTTVKVPNNDWLISPQLSGRAQTITFWARALNSKYPEQWDILYSTTDADTASFVNLASERSFTKTAFTQQSYQLPEGAKYFAFRYCGDGSNFATLLDDFAYEGLGQVELQGYYVYRDGQRLSAEPLTDTAYTDAAATNGEHHYAVTCLYREGESRPSNVVSLVDAGVADIRVNAPAETGRYDMQGRRVAVGYRGPVIVTYADGTAAKIMAPGR